MLFWDLVPRVDNAGGDVRGAGERYEQAAKLLSQGSNSLAGMVTNYAEVAAAVDAGAVANPDNRAWQELKAKKDIAIADRLTVKEDIDCILAAFAKVASHGPAAVVKKLNELA